MVGIFLIYATFSQLLSFKDEIIAGEKHITELDAKFKNQQNVILQFKDNQQDKKAFSLLDRVDVPNLSVFISHISTLAKKNYVDIESIRPLYAKEMDRKNTDFNINSFQISARGDYEQLLNFMRGIDKLPNLAIMGDFQIMANLKMGSKAEQLELLMMVHLYGR